MRFLILFLALAWSAFGDIALVQSASSPGRAVTSLSVSFPSANAPGNLIVVFMRMSSTTQTATVSDSAGNTYTQVVSIAQTSDGHQAKIFYAPNSKAGGNTVTVSFSATNNYPFLSIFEYSGLDRASPLDQVASAQASSAAPTATTAATTSANELVFAGVGLAANSGTDLTPTPGAGFTIREKSIAPSGVAQGATEDEVVSATGAQTASMTFGVGANWSMVVATFIASTAPPPARVFPHPVVF